MILQCWFHILESFITILYHVEKHSGFVVLLERPELYYKSAICSIRERDEIFQNGQKCKDKDFNLAYSGWNGLKIG